MSASSLKHLRDILIFSEEPGLKNRFGNDYQVYKNQVSRWIPKIQPFKKHKCINPKHFIFGPKSET